MIVVHSSFRTNI